MHAAPPLRQTALLILGAALATIGGALICLFALNKAWLVLQSTRKEGA